MMNRADYIRYGKERRWRKAAKESQRKLFDWIEEMTSTKAISTNQVRHAMGLPELQNSTMPGDVGDAEQGCQRMDGKWYEHEFGINGQCKFCFAWNLNFPGTWICGCVDEGGRQMVRGPDELKCWTCLFKRPERK